MERRFKEEDEKLMADHVNEKQVHKNNIILLKFDIDKILSMKSVWILNHYIVF